MKLQLRNIFFIVRLGFLIGLTALFAVATGCTTSATMLKIGPADPPRFEAVLKPLVEENGKVSAIAVDSVVYGGLKESADGFILTAPVVYAGAYGIADRIRDLEVTDSKGGVPLDRHDDPELPGGFPYFRHWRAKRQLSFPVRVRYRTEVEVPTDRRGPPFNIRPSEGGVSGAGSGFLVIPESVNSNLSRVRWNLEAFQTFSTGISSWGVGEFELAGAPADLTAGWYMAGPVGRYPATGDVNGFSAAWLGKFPFDPAAEMEFTGKAYRWLADFFGYMSPPPRYRVFMRIIESKLTHFSGTALDGSFMLSGGPKSGEETNGAAPRGTLFHEMIHMWVGQVEGPQGVTSWFSEGLTSYYTLVLPLRGQFETMEQYAANIAELAERYYTSPAINMSAEEIAQVGFGDETIRSTPYSRGAIYFADLDARISAKSGGKRSLDDLTFALFQLRHADPDFIFDHDAWIAAVSAELGPEAGDEFNARIIEGKPMVPVSDAFGPCFERRPAIYTVEERQVDGYEWVRKPDLQDQQCTAN